MKTFWKQSRRAHDTIMIKDGQETYYTGIFTDIDEAIDDFTQSYDHNDISGEVRCTATDLQTNVQKEFIIEGK